MRQPLTVPIGQRFGRLVVKEECALKQSGHRRFVCTCDCGKETTVNLNNLRRFRTKSCRCEQGNGHKMPPGDGAFNHLYLIYQRNAEVRSLPFALSKKEFRSLTSGNCAYCGTPPSARHVTTRSNGGYVHNGVDRVDNSKGYTLDNTVSCCQICNKIKGSCDVQTFKETLKDWVKQAYQTLYKD